MTSKNQKEEVFQLDEEQKPRESQTSEYQDLMSNLNSKTHSDSESGSELENEIAQKVGSPVDSKNRDWWQQLKSNLEKETEKQFLEEVETQSPKVSAQRRTRRKTRSWLESRDDIHRAMSIYNSSIPDLIEAKDKQASAPKNPTVVTSSTTTTTITTTKSDTSTTSTSSTSHTNTSVANAIISGKITPSSSSTSSSSMSWWDQMKESLEQDEKATTTTQKSELAVPEPKGMRTSTSSETSAWESKPEMDSNPSTASNSGASTPLSISKRSSLILDDGHSDNKSWWESLKSALEQETATTTPVKSNAEKSDVSSPDKDSSEPSTPNPLVGPSPAASPAKADVGGRSRTRASSIPPAAGKFEEETGGSQVLKIFNGIYRGDTIAGGGNDTAIAHGNGMFTSNGEIYLGQWQHGKRHGRGLRTWKDGKEYVGTWDNNRRSGAGMMNWGGGEIFVGEIMYGFQQGNGMMSFANGDRYFGEWSASERHGYGMMIYKNGDTYHGEWKHNKKEGFGIYRHGDGRPPKEGYWKENKFVGKTKYKE